MRMKPNEESTNQRRSHLYSPLAFSSLSKRPSSLDTVNVLELLASSSVKYHQNATEIQRKLEKPLLLDNPETKRLKKSRRIKCNATMMKSAARRIAQRQSFTDLSLASLLPLHRLWEGYIRELVSSTPRDNLENALLRADYHGAILRIIQSRCPSMVGGEGLVIQETMQTFSLKSRDNKLLVLPKMGNVFECCVNLSELETSERRIRWRLYGDQLCQHSGLRSSKKYKSKNSVCL